MSRAPKIVASMADNDKVERMFSRLASIEPRLSNTEHAVETLSRHMDAKFTAMDGRFSDIGDKLEDVIRAVQVQAAQPRWQVGEMLSIVQSGATLMGMGAAAIIWIAWAITSAPQARFDRDIVSVEKRIEKLETVFEKYALRNVGK